MPEQHEASAAAPRSEELAGVGVWSIDLASRVLTTNAAARAMLEWAPERGLPALADFLAVVHPDDVRLVHGYTSRLSEHGQEYVIEHRVLLPSGRALDVRASGTAERGADGRIAVLHGITLDLTDLSRVARAREQERDHARALLAGLTEGYWVSTDGILVEVNDALCRMTGFSVEELVGTVAPYPFWPPGQDQGLVAPGMRGTEGRVELLRKDASQLTVALTASVMAPSEGSWTQIVLVRDTTSEREHQRQLEVRAMTDPLTGVRNSRAFRDDLAAAVARWSSIAAPLSLALIDIDHFKAVNDEHGHAAGDGVLVAVVERLVAATRHVGALARVGGDEFALLLPGLDPAHAREIVAEALAGLRSADIPVAGRVTASAGVAGLAADMDESALYQLADAQMYAAKRQGRDRVL